MKILFVCLGNICRSPTAEGVTRHLLRTEHPELAVEFDSAGTAGYHVGDPPDPRTQQAARARGIDLSGLRARQIAARDFVDFDWIWAMDRANLADLSRLRPAAAKARIGLFLECAPEAGLLEVPDPYYGDAADFERVLDLCMLAGRGLLEKLRGS